MVFPCDSKPGRLFFVGLTLLVAARVANGQQVGVSLKLHGVLIPNNSLVEFDDLLYRTANDPYPTNANGLHDQTLVCVTDLVDCCNTPVRGDWYYPDGHRVDPDFGGRQLRFLSNRGPNQIINGSQFYGSVRLFRRWTPRERGKFHCVIPDVDNVSQSLYANIVEFGTTNKANSPVSISSSGSRTAGETSSLMCSTNLVAPFPLPSGIPTPRFEWFFNDTTSLPSDVTLTATSLSGVDNRTYTSVLHFSPLSQFHTGTYACQLGAGRLINSAVVIVKAPNISIQIISSGNQTLGQRGFTLTCTVNGTENLNSTVTFQWTKLNGSRIHKLGGDSRLLSFSPLKLSDAGQYTCQIIISSPHLSNNITVTDSQRIGIQIPVPISVTLSSNLPSPIQPVESDVTLTCTIVLTSGPEIDIPLRLNMTFKLSRREPVESQLIITPSLVPGSTYTTRTVINSFGREQSGEYACTAMVTSEISNTFLIDSNATSDLLRVTTGVYLVLRGMFIPNNSQVNINNIGLSSDIPNGALQCITDRVPCCLSQNSRFGEWYLPNRILVHGAISTREFYRNRGDNGNVSLNHPRDIMSPTGEFCCEIPDATDTSQTLCVNIGEVSIRVSGSLIAGEYLSLECFADSSMGTFQWLGPPEGRTPVVSDGFLTISSNSTISQLQFRPLKQSHNGSYSCMVSTGGQNLSSQPLDIRITVPSVAVEISSNGTTPTAGDDYQLICTVSGIEKLNSIVSYLWTKNSNSQIQDDSNTNTLSFTPILLSHAANYACMVTVASSYLTGNIVTRDFQEIRIQFPTPSTVTLTSSERNSTVIIGSDVTLTCTVELHSTVLGSEIFLLTVDAQLSRDGIPLTLAGPIVTGTTFTYTIQLNSFGRSDSGNYTCTATIRPHPTSTYLTGTEVLSDIIIFKATFLPPVDVRSTQSSSSGLVEVSWSPPSDGANIITGYRIFYGNGQNVSVPSVITFIGLVVDESYVGQTVSIRSETGQVYSDIINVTVALCIDVDEQSTGGTDLPVSTSSCSCSCVLYIGISVGVTIVVMCIVVIIITIIVRRCQGRKSPHYAVSANMSYNQVNLKHGEIGEVYDSPNIMCVKSCENWDNIEASSLYETINSSKLGPIASDTVYATTDEAVMTN